MKRAGSMVLTVAMGWGVRKAGVWVSCGEVRWGIGDGGR